MLPEMVDANHLKDMKIWFAGQRNLDLWPGRKRCDWKVWQGERMYHW